ncbi:MAG: hypothetical protein JWN03_8311 [Nocardia sp.]|nr:hypothetical protein [Nocardia sp.]
MFIRETYNLTPAQRDGHAAATLGARRVAFIPRVIPLISVQLSDSISVRLGSSWVRLRAPFAVT